MFYKRATQKDFNVLNHADGNGGNMIYLIHIFLFQYIDRSNCKTHVNTSYSATLFPDCSICHSCLAHARPIRRQQAVLTARACTQSRSWILSQRSIIHQRHPKSHFASHPDAGLNTILPLVVRPKSSIPTPSRRKSPYTPTTLSPLPHRWAQVHRPLHPVSRGSNTFTFCP